MAVPNRAVGIAVAAVVAITFMHPSTRNLWEVWELQLCCSPAALFPYIADRSFFCLFSEMYCLSKRGLHARRSLSVSSKAAYRHEPLGAVCNTHVQPLL